MSDRKVIAGEPKAESRAPGSERGMFKGQLSVVSRQLRRN
jgi:hypothetical protein